MDSWEQARSEAEAAQGRSDVATTEAAWRHAVQISRQQFNRFDHRTALSLERLAEVYWKQSKFREALPVCDELLQIYELKLGPDHADVGVLVQNIAMLNHAQGNLSAAEPAYQRALRIRRKALGAPHPDVQNLVQAYSQLLVSSGREAEAEDLKADAQSVASGKWNRSGHYRAVNLAEIEALVVQEAITPTAPAPEEGRQQGVTPPPDHQEEPAAPEEQPQRQLQWSEPTWQQRWNDFMDKGDQALEEGLNEEAEQAFSDALEVLKEFKPDHDSQLTMTLESLAEALWQQGKHEDAQPICQLTLEIYEEMLGPNNQDVGIIANNLAMLYHAVGEYEKAELLYKRALGIRTLVLGSSHPDVISLLTNYANLLFLTGRDKEAKHLKSYIRSLTSGKWSRCGQFKAMSAPLTVPDQTAKVPAKQLVATNEEILLYERLVTATNGKLDEEGQQTR